MSDGPAPGLVTDWLTPGAFLGVFWLLCLLALTFYILDYRGECDRCADEPASVPVSPCAPQGHRYVAQPATTGRTMETEEACAVWDAGALSVTWRCGECGDERVSEQVYDQERVA